MNKNIILIVLIIIILLINYYFVSDEKFTNMNNIEMYCINLDRSKNRWNKILKKFKNYNVKRFPAVNGKELNIEDLDKNILNLSYNTDLNAICDKSVKRGMELKLSKSEIGCILSHYYLWKHIEKENLDMCLIMEDDIHPKHNFHEFKNLLKYVPNDWDIVYLSFINSGKKKFINKEKNIYIPVCGFTTGGYLVSKKGIKKLVKMLPIDGPIDLHLLNLFYHNKIKAYVIDGLCDVSGVWGGSDSSIEHSTRNIKKFQI